jgi:hypothetical protein
MIINLNLSTLLTGAITAAVNAAAVLVAGRYVAKAIERVESKGQIKRMVTKMQAELTLRTNSNTPIGYLHIDTADMPEELAAKLSLLSDRQLILVSIRCGGCESWLGDLSVDRKYTDDQIQEQINAVILAHRSYCDCYKQR